MAEQDEPMWTEEDEVMEVDETPEGEEDTTFGESMRSSADISDDVAQSQPQAPEEMEDELEDPDEL